jgi:glycosidase
MSTHAVRLAAISAVCAAGLALLAPPALAGEAIEDAWYGKNPVGSETGAANPYALVTRENEPGFSYTPSPEDWRDRNIYQLFTDRFATDGTCNLNNLDDHRKTWFYANGNAAGWPVTRNFHMGGNWRGLKQQIPYLQGMGVTAVWISGVQANEQAVRYGGTYETRWTPYHQYHVDNFFMCEPASGTFAELKDLIDALHAAGIAVILDVAPNHMSDKCGRQGNYGNDDKYYTSNRDGWWWDEGKKHPAPFDDLERFHVNGTINNWDTSPENLIGQFKGTDDLRQEDGTTSDLLHKAFRNLIDATDCDGFRVDAIKHIPYDWCRNWAQAMRDHAATRGKKNFLVFGELFSYDHGALSSWCNDGYGFNSSLDFPLMQAMNNAFGNGYSPYQLGEEMNKLSQYGKSAQNVIAFLDNHDVNRFAFAYGGDSKANAVRIMKPAMSFLYLAPPIPLLYYGTEHAFNQGWHGNGTDRNGDEYSPWYNPDDSDWQRECMFDPNATWHTDSGFQPGNAEGDMFSDGAKDNSLYYHIAWLNHLRNSSIALRRGGFAQRKAAGGQGLYAFTKWYDQEVALVLLNTGDGDCRVSDYDGGWIEVGIKNQEFKENGDGDSIGWSSDSGWLDLSSVVIEGKGTKIFICNYSGEGGGGGGGGDSMWVQNVYGYPTESATTADDLYINCEAGPADKITEVEVFYYLNPTIGGGWPSSETGSSIMMEVNADWGSEGGKWWHVQLPAGTVTDEGTLYYFICARDAEGKEVFANNSGNNYSWTISKAPVTSDFSIDAVARNPVEPAAGDTVAVTATIKATDSFDISTLTVTLACRKDGAEAVSLPMALASSDGATHFFTCNLADVSPEDTYEYAVTATAGETSLTSSSASFVVPPIPYPEGLAIIVPTAPATETDSATYSVNGTAGYDIIGDIDWTNALSGASGTIPFSHSWSLDAALETGDNELTFTAPVGATSVATNAQDSAAAYDALATGDNKGAGFGPWTLKTTQGGKLVLPWVVFEPLPANGESTTVTYYRGRGILDTAGAVKMHWSYATDDEGTAIVETWQDTDMTLDASAGDNGAWSCSIVVPADAKKLIVCFTDGNDAWDSNDNANWVAPVVNYAGCWADANGFGLWSSTDTSTDDGNFGATLAEDFRPFADPMAVGDTFSIFFKNNWILEAGLAHDGSSAGSVGFALQDADGESLFQFFFNGGDEYYSYSGTGDGGATGIPWTGDGMIVAVTRTSDTAFSATATLADGSKKSFTGTLSGAPARLRVWSYANGIYGGEGNENRTLYFDDIAITRASTAEATTASAKVIITRTGATPEPDTFVPVTGITFTDNASGFSFAAPAGYDVIGAEYTDDLVTGNWRKTTAAPVFQDGRWIVLREDGTPTSFYKIEFAPAE